MRLLFFALLLFSLATHAQNSLFEKYFEPQGAVRYDYNFVGNSQSIIVSHQQSKFLPYWGGNPNFLIDTLNYGNFRYLLNDIQSGELIFSKGFSSLFGEWVETDEALVKSRSYAYSLYFPKPKINLMLSIQQRSNKNEWQTIFTDTFFIDNIFIKEEVSALWDIDTLIYNGASSEKVDLAILAEGYIDS
ncbi:MAG TPA: peptidase M64 N-terminal domain-containing protein, partial [Prolixibacteraceae bacterium]|nr:peptidase M64 N-terminal domain-containing protein [Prolixibacteraceae bacterium]